MTTGLGAGRYLAAGERPDTTVTSVHELTTADGATVRGVLAAVPGARTVVCLMHPRQDLTHHPLVPLLLQAGAAVWTQHTRSVNNDRPDSSVDRGVEPTTTYRRCSQRWRERPQTPCRQARRASEVR